LGRDPLPRPSSRRVAVLLLPPAGGGLLLRGQATVRCEVIDSVRQVFRELRQQLLPRHARLLLQFVDGVRPESMRELVRCKPSVLARAHPGVGMVAIAVLPELIEQAT
jgi:hypothetical protein